MLGCIFPSQPPRRQPHRVRLNVTHCTIEDENLFSSGTCVHNVFLMHDILILVPEIWQKSLGLLPAALRSRRFSGYVEAFDLVQTLHRQPLDLQKLMLRLNIEKCRFYTWGEATGLTAPAGTGRRPLESFQFKTFVQETLDVPLRLFSDTSKIKARYGCREICPQETATQALDRANPVDNVASCFANLTKAGRKCDSSIKKKILWVAHDRKKIGELIFDVKDLVDGLQDITKTISTTFRQEQILTHRIQQIEEVETLHLVSAVCDTWFPRSVRLTTSLSLIPLR
jgi:Prion-inhibition and propagation